MSAAVDSQGAASSAAAGDGSRKFTNKQILLILVGIWLGGVVVLGAIYGIHGTRNTSFEPQNEFKLDTWVNLGIFSINKAVLYLFLAAIATSASMIYIARRMQQRPNKVQAAVEVLYELPRAVWGDNIQGALDFAEPVATEGEAAFVDDTDYPHFGKAKAPAAE